MPLLRLSVLVLECTFQKLKPFIYHCLVNIKASWRARALTHVLLLKYLHVMSIIDSSELCHLLALCIVDQWTLLYANEVIS